MGTKFDFDKPFTIDVKGAWKETDTIIFCDYTRSADITQDGITYPARVGYCGRDKTKSVMRYLFLGDKIYYLDIEVFHDSMIDFPEWLTR